MIGRDLEDIVVDGSITKAPCGGEQSSRSPVDRGKQGLNRSTMTEPSGIPFHLVSSGANRHDAPLLAPALAELDVFGPLSTEVTVHLDRGYDSAKSRTLLVGVGLTGVIARKGIPAPIQVGSRWVVEWTPTWMNGSGKLRRCTERNGTVVDFYLFLATAFVVTRALIRHARKRYRWPNRPTTPRLK